MKCSRCRKALTKPEFSKAHIERDENGRIKRVLHNKCYMIERRDHMLWKAERSAPSAYEERARYRNADDIAAEVGTTDVGSSTDPQYKE